MKVVIALGGNALLQRGQPLEADIQKENIRKAAEMIARISDDHQVILTHGNGPQVGLLALQNAAYKEVTPYPLDVLGAETAGMIGYMLNMEIRNHRPKMPIVTMVTETLVDINDPAFENPTKYVGPVYSKDAAEKLAQEKNWHVKPDGEYYRRVVPSPKPQRVIEGNTVRQLSDTGALVICSGGGGIPVCQQPDGTLDGIEAVVDKDLTAAIMAKQLKADALIIMTDVNAVSIHFGKPDQKQIQVASPEQICELDLPAGSMGPKVEAAADFVKDGGKFAAIGSLYDLEEIISNKAGTRITEEHKSATMALYQ